MLKTGLLTRMGIVRGVFKKDILYVLIPFITVFYTAMYFSAKDGLVGFWDTIWGLIRQPQSRVDLSVWIIAGLALFIIGFVIIMVGHVTLWKNYSSFLVIHKHHQLITNGIYRFIRNPIYLGTLMGCFGLTVYSTSLRGFLISLLLVPIFLIRIRLEEGLLAEEFQETFTEYKKTTKRLIPLIY